MTVVEPTTTEAPEAAEPKGMTTEEVAQRLGLSVYTVQAYMRKGELKARKINRKWRVSEDDLQSFIERRAQEGLVPEA